MAINPVRFPAANVNSDLLKSVYSSWNKTSVENEESARPKFNPVSELFGSVNNMQNKAEQSAVDFSLGESENIHRVVVDMEESLLSTKLLVNVRNKALEAYQEIMRMQV